MTQDVSGTQEGEDEDDEELDGASDEDPSGDIGASEYKRPMHPNSLANLRPAWTPGLSGNPSGLTKDGRFANSPRRVLEDQLNREEQRPLKRLVANWIKHANKGSAKHLELILNRIDPDSLGGDQKVVFEGIRIETRGEARVLVARGELEPASEREQRPSEPGETTTFALSRAQESHGGALDAHTRDPERVEQISPSGVVTQQETSSTSVPEGSPPAQ